MEATAQPRGLVGLIRSVFGAANGAAKTSIGLFAKPELWAVRLAALAGFVAIYVKSGAPTFGFEPVVFALAIGFSGLMFEALSAKNVMRSFWEGRPFGVGVWSMLWICAFAYSAFNWISVAAENEAGKTNMHKAAAFRTADVRSGVELATKRLNETRAKAENLRAAAWESIPTVGGVKITDVAQADALIQKAKGHTKFWDLTDGCVTTKGPQTRAFCAEYRDALAAKASAEKRGVIDQEYKDAEAEVARAEEALTEARSLASSTPIETKSERADLLILANIIGVEGDHKEQVVEQYSAIFKIIAVSIFLSLGAAMVELERLRTAGPRRKLNIFARIYRFFYGLMFGNAPPNYHTEEHVHNHVSVSDDRAIKALRDLADRIKMPTPQGAAA